MKEGCLSPKKCKHLQLLASVTFLDRRSYAALRTDVHYFFRVLPMHPGDKDGHTQVVNIMTLIAYTPLTFALPLLEGAPKLELP